MYAYLVGYMHDSVITKVDFQIYNYTILDNCGKIINF